MNKMVEPAADPGGHWLVLVESNTTGTGRLFATAGRAMGLRPVLLTADPGRYAYRHSGATLPYFSVDTSDTGALRDACASLAEQAPIAAVLSSSEYFVAAAAQLASERGLPAPDPNAVSRCRDKAVQRDILAGTVPMPRYASCRSPRHAATVATAIGRTVVVKPCLGSGSEGVRACTGPDEAADWAARLLAADRNERGIPVEPRVLVEELIEGPEYSVELLDGAAQGVTAKHLGARPYFVETGHDFPAPLGRSAKARLVRTAERAAHVLGLGHGPAHVELRLRNGRSPVLIEVNPRLAGGMIPRLVELATGHSIIASCVASAMGRPHRRTMGAAHHAAVRFLTIPHEGTVSAVAGLDRADALPGIIEVSCTAKTAERRRQHHSFRDRVGHVISLGETAAEAAAAAETARRAIRIDVAADTRALTTRRQS